MTVKKKVIKTPEVITEVKPEGVYIEFIVSKRNITSVNYDINWIKISNRIKKRVNFLLSLINDLLKSYWLRYTTWFNKVFNHG
jgi:hypothetical protein